MGEARTKEASRQIVIVCLDAFVPVGDWTASIDSILEKVGRCKAVLDTVR